MMKFEDATSQSSLRILKESKTMLSPGDADFAFLKEDEIVIIRNDFEPPRSCTSAARLGDSAAVL